MNGHIVALRKFRLIQVLHRQKGRHDTHDADSLSARERLSGLSLTMGRRISEVLDRFVEEQEALMFYHAVSMTILILWLGGVVGTGCLTILLGAETLLGLSNGFI